MCTKFKKRIQEILSRITALLKQAIAFFKTHWKAFAAACSAAAAFFLYVVVKNKQRCKKILFTTKQNAEEERKKEYEKVSQTPAGDLVSNADNADELQSIKLTIKDDAANAIQNRIEESGL
ncbi:MULTISPECIES: hypothetical protein [Treponema]|uniref:Uncharacterized protein n=1 Tax=Treponema phagedenis TaxID=162 RepID=A0AAE6IUF0_TREPH|nr:hypothetical protein [Treponema phagedenis]NVP24907.1 hypothetical protein [Treponema phagedenis]QEJ96630.1 hypothetical protein FUT82_00470 [Treponema phagedenis]QEJ97452.1 hypothetical protein FUT82_05190 [Treponema phagedenis]QEK02417.1 hypothetical protein FUT83_00470 [Treponema phagedenis]QEK03993.1 hypothetical protein FUT83_09385 [Treponema phagedenis]